MNTNVIRLLPDHLANQIAAGEVVQRPASVVKELLENAVDAGATHISLIVKEAGKTLVQVIDNGSGMNETDARMCFERHATSKLSKQDDLFTIRTMGFRGEAMASIAAVAQVELKTRQEENDTATFIRIEASELLTHEQSTGQPGTSVSVKNLFFNVPARRNFLKSNPVELRHILDEFTRIALAFPEKSFSFFQNDLETYNLTPGKLSHRIVSLFGNNYREQLAPCEEETDFLRVSGYVGKPESARKSRGEQFFFVNRRFIKSSYLHHAVADAFRGMIDEDSHPFYVLFIEIDPIHIDINVHPTKTEIKFDDERTVYGIIHAVVRKALATYHVKPKLDFEENVNHNPFSLPVENKAYPGNKPPAPRLRTTDMPNLNNWQTLYSQFERSLPLPTDQEAPQTTMELKFESAINRINMDAGYQTNLSKDQLAADSTHLFQLHNSYIVTQVKSGMLVIDQQAAHERILCDKYLNMLDKNLGASQQFLFPQTIELNPADFALVIDLEHEIHSLGFSFSIFGRSAIVVNGIPSDVRSGDEKALFEGFIEQFNQNRKEIGIDNRLNLARSLAKRSALRKGIKLAQTEMMSLIDQLFSCDNPGFAPDGDKTLIILDMEKLGSFFAR